jgi:hypothetical protein
MKKACLRHKSHMATDTNVNSEFKQVNPMVSTDTTIPTGLDMLVWYKYFASCANTNATEPAASIFKVYERSENWDDFSSKIAAHTNEIRQHTFQNIIFRINWKCIHVALTWKKLMFCHTREGQGTWSIITAHTRWESEVQYKKKKVVYYRQTIHLLISLICKKQRQDANGIYKTAVFVLRCI